VQLAFVQLVKIQIFDDLEQLGVKRFFHGIDLISRIPGRERVFCFLTF
jgi:hypothetical protein